MFRISILFIFIFLFSNAQEKSYPEIDSLYFKVYNSSHDSGNFQKGIIEIQELISQCKRSKYRLGTIRGYIYAGNFSSTMDLHQDALKYFDLAEQELKKVKDFSLEAELHIEFGKIYHFMGLYDVSNQHYDRGIRASKQIKNLEDRKSGLAYAYACKADNLVSMNEVDSIKLYFQKAFKINPDAITASNIAFSFIRYNPEEIDSAAHYLKIGEELALTSSVYQKYAVLKVYGDFFYAKKNYNNALKYYFKALENSKKNKFHELNRIIYELIAKTYSELNNNEKSAEYLRKYTTLNDSLNSVDKKTLNLSVAKLIKNKEEEKENEKSKIKTKSYYFIAAFSLAIVIIIIGFIFYKQKTKVRENIIHKQKKEIIIKETERKQMEDKVNDAFEEVMQMAKNNDPKFLARFKEVYPEFCKKILNLQPDILNSEFTFCAYLKLNLSTKEIANYTFVTEKTVQSRKSRLRKKMNISSEVDLYIWINKI